MIQAMVFDLDGTLVRTERLKAESYARAAVRLCPDTITEEEVVEAFKSLVGLSRREVAESLIERFNLQASPLIQEYGVSEPWQAYVQLRLQIYDDLISDPETIRSSQWEHNVDLLKLARSLGCKTALATMSSRARVRQILSILNLAEYFDFTAARDDVEHGKPHPEIYLLISHQLGIPPANCLAIEDSPVGVQAALDTGMHVIAVTTPFTIHKLHAANLLDHRWIVDNPDELPAVVRQCFEQLR